MESTYNITRRTNNLYLCVCNTLLRFALDLALDPFDVGVRKSTKKRYEAYCQL